MILSRLFAIPEVTLSLFAFLLHFVYETWEAPYFDFYKMPSLANKVDYITHCTFGDGVIMLITFWIVSLLFRTRHWILSPGKKQVLLLIVLGWLYMFISEIYRIKVAKMYGISIFKIPFFETSWLPLLQWLILPPLIVFFTRHYLRGYQKYSSKILD